MATWRSWCTSNSRPSAESMPRARALPSSVTDSVAYQTVTPWPICAGVLGIARTMAGCSSAVPSAAVEAPATTLTTSCCGASTGRSSGKTSSSTCGLTARSTTSAPRAASALLSVACTPCASSRARRRSARGWLQTTLPGSTRPWRSNPASMLSAITPVPTTPTRAPCSGFTGRLDAEQSAPAGQARCVGVDGRLGDLDVLAVVAELHGERLAEHHRPADVAKPAGAARDLPAERLREHREELLHVEGDAGVGDLGVELAVGLADIGVDAAAAQGHHLGEEGGELLHLRIAAQLRQHLADVVGTEGGVEVLDALAVARGAPLVLHGGQILEQRHLVGGRHRQAVEAEAARVGEGLAAVLREELAAVVEHDLDGLVEDRLHGHREAHPLRALHVAAAAHGEVAEHRAELVHHPRGQPRDAAGVDGHPAVQGHVVRAAADRGAGQGDDLLRALALQHVGRATAGADGETGDQAGGGEPGQMAHGGCGAPWCSCVSDGLNDTPGWWRGGYAPQRW